MRNAACSLWHLMLGTTDDKLAQFRKSRATRHQQMHLNSNLTGQWLGHKIRESVGCLTYPFPATPEPGKLYHKQPVQSCEARYKLPARQGPRHRDQHQHHPYTEICNRYGLQCILYGGAACACAAFLTLDLLLPRISSDNYSEPSSPQIWHKCLQPVSK